MSRPFRFGLERVREIRAHDEDQAKERFAASLNARMRGEAALRAAEQHLREAQSGVTAPALGPLSGATLVARQAWVERLEQSRADAQLRMANYEADLQSKRGELAQASQKREVLDQLKTKQREAHKAETERVEAANLDEMALQMYSRRSAAA
jgi:flagellar protein FliJ